MTIGASGVALILAALPAWGAEDASGILKRWVDAENRNWEQARQYAFTKDAEHYQYDKSGKARGTGSESYQILFVEGISYQRLVARNGKPLAKAEEAGEEKKMRQTAAERREQRRSGRFYKESVGADEQLVYHVSTGANPELLTSLFDCQLLGEEEILGRKASVVDCVPHPGHTGANEDERDFLSIQYKLWIDQTESVTLKRVETVIGEGRQFKPGTVLTREYEKINNDAWLPRTGVLDSPIQPAENINGRNVTESRFSNYKKFNVESTITTVESTITVGEPR